MRVYLHNRKDVFVFKDGEALDIKMQSGREYVEFDAQDGEDFSLEFVKKSEFSQPMWFVKAIIFWIVGIMGFFTPKYNKNTFSLNCTLSSKASKKPIILGFNFSNPKYEPSVAIRLLEARDDVILQGEKYEHDEIAKSRRRLYQFVSGVLRLVVIASLAFVIIKALLGF